MAKMKREIKKFRNLEIKGKVKSWWQNKIKIIRKTTKPQAKRLQRLTKKFGSLGIVILAAGITLASFFLPKNQLQILKEKLVKSPYDLEAHLELAKIFLGANQFAKAEKELLVAQSLQQLAQGKKQPKVLGTSSLLEKLWQQKHYSDPKDIKKLISGWEEVLEKYPDYRDGYLQLAYLYYKLDKNKQAKENLKKALALDPNWEKTKELKEIIFEDLLDKEFLE
jgi:tetratricopeptide (TPR) repeat protein